MPYLLRLQFIEIYNLSIRVLVLHICLICNVVAHSPISNLHQAKEVAQFFETHVIKRTLLNFPSFNTLDISPFKTLPLCILPDIETMSST